MVDVADTPVVAILTRAPSARGKTRLFASLGLPPDPSLLTALLLDTLDGTVAPGVRRVVAVTPAAGCDEVRHIIDDPVIDIVPQAAGSLGERMRALMAALFAGGSGAVVLTGSDVPQITPSIVEEALALVAHDRNSLVLGPAADGGYYLIAAQRMPDVFANVAWSTSAVLDQTMRSAANAGFRVRLLNELADVDTADELQRAAQSGCASRTRAWWLSAQRNDRIMDADRSYS
jgi:uncharacterized protein